MAEQTLPGYSVTISQPVQWGEQDGLGHINNMHFIRWFESARIAYLLECGIEITNTGVGPILAAVSCNYRQQVTYPDTLIVGARVTRIGRSSMAIEHQLWSEQLQAVAAEGDSTVVMFDYHNQKSFAISPDLRARIEAIENKSFS
jgi:acyl-CoA thioester hydrolase